MKNALLFFISFVMFGDQFFAQSYHRLIIFETEWSKIIQGTVVSSARGLILSGQTHESSIAILQNNFHPDMCFIQIFLGTSIFSKRFIIY